MFESDKQRIIQEFVPGKQVTMAHLIAHPVEELYAKLGVVSEKRGASLPSPPAKPPSSARMPPPRPRQSIWFLSTASAARWSSAGTSPA